VEPALSGVANCAKRIRVKVGLQLPTRENLKSFKGREGGLSGYSKMRKEELQNLLTI